MSVHIAEAQRLSYEGHSETILTKANYLTFNQLVLGSSPSQPTTKTKKLSNGPGLQRSGGESPPIDSVCYYPDFDPLGLLSGSLS
jgi:hypothetical protein